jgi:hypothetical protein
MVVDGSDVSSKQVRLLLWHLTRELCDRPRSMSVRQETIENATDVTKSLCPINFATMSRNVAFHKQIVYPFYDEVMRNPSDENDTSVSA